MTVKLRKWIFGAEREPSTFLIWETVPLEAGWSATRSLVATRDTSNNSDGCHEIVHAPLHYASTMKAHHGRVSMDVKVKDNVRRLQEELSLQFQNELIRRRERPLSPTETEPPRLPLWVTIFLSVSVPFLIIMVAREINRIKNWNWETWVSNDQFQREYYDP